MICLSYFVYKPTAMNCVNRHGDQLYVNMQGMYKVGIYGRPMYANYRSIFRAMSPSKTLKTISMKRVFAYTFDTKSYHNGLSVQIDMDHEDYNPDILTPGCLYWAKRKSEGKRTARSKISEDQSPRDGELWAENPRLRIRVSSMNRYVRESDNKIIEFVTDKYLTPRGYFTVGIRGTIHRFHRVVAETFLGSAPHESYVVDHVDGNTYNNSPLNLRWCTPSENNMNARPRSVRVESDPSADGWVLAIHPYFT